MIPTALGRSVYLDVTQSDFPHSTAHGFSPITLLPRRRNDGADLSQEPGRPICTRLDVGERTLHSFILQSLAERSRRLCMRRLSERPAADNGGE